MTVSSSGRGDTGPHSRAAWLVANLDDEPAEVGIEDDGAGLFRKIDMAERALALAEEEHYQAAGEARAAREAYPETGLASYDLSPGARTRFLAWREAESRELKTSRARGAGRSHLDRLLATFEAIQSRGMGLPLGPLGEAGDPYGSDDGSLAWAQHAAERARKRRIR